MASRFFIAKSAPLAAAAAAVLTRFVPAANIDLEADHFGAVVEGTLFPVSGLQSMFEVARESAAAAQVDPLLGADPRDRAHVNQWIGMAADIASGAAEPADAELVLPMGAQFVAGTGHATAADLLLYVAVASAAQSNPKALPKLAKWSSRAGSDPLVAPFASLAKSAPAAADGAAGGAPTDAGDSKQPKFVKPNEAEIAARRAAKEKEKAEKEAAKAAAGPAAAGAAPAKAAEAPLSSMDLDIRVGLIVSIEKHPKADRLFVEKIDLGEATGPRQIVSGLVQYYAAEQLQGKFVLVVANMKPKPLVGIDSHGMVLCASVEVPAAEEGAAASTKLELVAVPEGTVPGERVHIGGKLAPQPPAVSKKILELLAPLRTDATGAVCWGEEPLAVPRGPITSTIPNALVK